MVTISGGTANFSGTGPVSPAIVNLSNGTRDGTSTVTVNSAMNWAGGTMSGSGRTIIPAGAMLNVINPSAVTLNTRTLESVGTVLWSGAGGMSQSAASFGSIFAPNRIDNAGTFRKSVSAGTTTIPSGLTFTNYGAVDIRSGILVANGGYASSSNALLNCALGGTSATRKFFRLKLQ
jgi:hypothetical protein